MFGLEGQELGQVIGGILLLVFGVGAILGGVAFRLWQQRRQDESPAVMPSPSREEILRQGLYDQRHAETLRVLGEVSRSAECAARASKAAAEASERAASMTDRMGRSLEQHLKKCEGRNDGRRMGEAVQ